MINTLVDIGDRTYRVCDSYDKGLHLLVYDEVKSEYGFAIKDTMFSEYYLSDVTTPDYDEMKGYIESTICIVDEVESVSQADLFKDTIDMMYSTYLDKNSDYGNSVEDTYNRYGDVSFLTRMRDKLNRLDSLCVDKKDARVADEKIEDTILDLANYAVLFYVTRKSNKGN